MRMHKAILLLKKLKQKKQKALSLTNTSKFAEDPQ